MVAIRRGKLVMIEQSGTTNKLPKIEYSSTVGWELGTISRLDDDRVPKNAISSGENVQLKQNGAEYDVYQITDSTETKIASLTSVVGR